jgi:hypothetical protein
MISRDDLPETPEWAPEPRCCPFDQCYVCQPHEGAGTYPLPERFVLGEN